MLKDWEERSASHLYHELSVFQKEAAVPVSAKGKKTKAVTVTTKLILIVSNWGFVRDNKDIPEKRRCTVHDVAIGLKLASSSFRPQGSASGTKNSTCPYDFDSHGATIPYPAFLSLIKDEEFTRDFICKVRRRYEDDTGLSALATRAGNKKTQATPKDSSWQANLRRRMLEQFPELADPAADPPSRKNKNRNNDNDVDDDDDDDDDNYENNDDDDDRPSALPKNPSDLELEHVDENHQRRTTTIGALAEVLLARKGIQPPSKGALKAVATPHKRRAEENQPAPASRKKTRSASRRVPVEEVTVRDDDDDDDDDDNNDDDYESRGLNIEAADPLLA